MSDGDEVCYFVWQCQQRKKWTTFSDEEICLLNKAVKEKLKDVLLPSKNSRKKMIIDFEKMVQRNQATSYEQKIRCLSSNSGFFVWLWRDEYDDWHCYKPYLVFALEVAYLKKEKKVQFHDNADFEVNLETFEQLNEETLSTCSVKRENIELTITAELKKMCSQNEVLFNEACSSGAPSAKRIRIDSSNTSLDINGKINLPQRTLNPMDIDDSANAEQASSSSADTSVDSECPDRENFHIYFEGVTAYSAILNQTNLQNNNNKFYIIQLLEHNRKKQFSVWRRWGRVGHKGQRDYSTYGSSFSEAKDSFEKKFYEKTRNHWSDHKNFVHVKGKYDLLHLDLNPEKKELSIPTKTGVKSKLVSKVQSLLELICDQKRMEDIMKEMSYDSNKTPLGKLTLKQVREGYIALNKIAAALSRGERGSMLLNACNEFYTKIPHNFGMKTPPIIQTQSDVDDKLRMLEALSNITVAMGVLNSKSDREEHPLDKYYRSLNCLLELVNPSSSEYVELEKCLKETHGPTHTTYEMEIIDAFKCCKGQEQSSFINHENKLLLWHGSRITNWVGILKEGLRIAPPEAPCTGYMFGKGIYFADVSTKSANYCFATKRKNEGLILMCEVSVGNQFPLTEADEDLPDGLPPDCNSVFAKGRVNPSEFKTGVLSSEAKAPVGPLLENHSHQGSLHYNEYIVYNVKQVKMKYLMRVKFNFK